MAEPSEQGDIALELLRTALAQLDLEDRRLPALLVQEAIEAIEEQSWKDAGVQDAHIALQ